mmetsp:Transcript_24373/g.63573  ORF Transcript_24373/g.63573 Transcript_24373/m.63573 type:complete len:205 (+) Transcript_24373:236-850(+)
MRAHGTRHQRRCRGGFAGPDQPMALAIGWQDSLRPQGPRRGWSHARSVDQRHASSAARPAVGAAVGRQHRAPGGASRRLRGVPTDRAALDRVSAIHLRGEAGGGDRTCALCRRDKPVGPGGMRGAHDAGEGASRPHGATRQGRPRATSVEPFVSGAARAVGRRRGPPRQSPGRLLGQPTPAHRPASPSTLRSRQTYAVAWPAFP